MEWLNDMFTPNMFRDVIIAAVPALICITIHELSHGFTAYKLGDNTAKDMGRLTLNPIKHIDILGLVMIVLVGFGWAKPVPVRMSNFKHPKWYMAITSFAGPLSNLVLAFIVMIIFMMLPSPYGGFESFALAAMSPLYGEPPIITLIIYRLVLINVYLAIFNLLPIPPLDGSKVVFSLLPEKWYYKLMKYERFGMILLLALIFSGRFLNFNLFGILIGRPAFQVLLTMAEWARGIVT